MGRSIESLYGQKVTAVLRNWPGLTVRGVLVHCDSTFVFLDVVRRRKKYEVVVPITSILQMWREPSEG
jgi:hypothetical protein